LFIAGDACHVHSSALAQGMNTGVHDAVNLGWKLAGVIKGLYKPSILDTYESERKPAAQYLIDLDKDASALISGDIPEHLMRADDQVDANQVLKKIFDESIRFNIGLGVHYGYNILNQRASSGMITPGWRAPDALVYRPGSRIPQSLFSLTKNSGLFWVLIFAGEPQKTRQGIQALAKYVQERDTNALAYPVHVNYLTIVAGSSNDVEIGLGHTNRLGNVYFDLDHSAHYNYSLTTGTGGIVILRPDGFLSYVGLLNEPEVVHEYFAQIMASPDLAVQV
jgi:phenol 2-monooxygenase